MQLFDEDKPSKDFYLFLKYNKIFEKDKVNSMGESELNFYNEFCRLFKELNSAFNTDDNNKASMLFGSLTNMFGFNRHFCSVTGTPILGAYYKIGGKIVSKEAYESYRIIMELEKKVLTEEKTKKSKNKK